LFYLVHYELLRKHAKYKRNQRWTMTDLPTDQPIQPELGPVPGGPAADPTVPVVPCPVDPLARTLDALEASIEQPPEVGDWSTQDPLARTLSRLEQSVDGRQPEPPAGWEQFLSVFDRIEERGPESTDDEGGPGLAASSLGMARRDSPLGTQAGAGPFRSAPLAPHDVDRRGSFFSKEHAQPTYHMMGGGAGIRGDSPELKGYCRLHEMWAWSDDCGGCSDYDAVDSDAGEADEGRCRHTLTPEQDEEGHDDGG
jgi:hypothetical protein